MNTILPETEELPSGESWFEKHQITTTKIVNAEGYTFNVYLETKTQSDSLDLGHVQQELSRKQEFWQQLDAKHAGRHTPVPRLSAFCSEDLNIGTEIDIKGVQYTSCKPTDSLVQVWNWLCSKFGQPQQPLHHVFCFKFANGNQSMGYHNWNPTQLGKHHCSAVAYLWLGESRPILYRNHEKKVTKRFEFVHSTLFVTMPGSWNDFQIQVPKAKGVESESILLIFE